MKNITITLPEETARWARVWAAQKGKSVSAAFAELLEEIRQENSKRRKDWNAFHKIPPRNLNQGGKYPSRDSLYER